MTLFLVISYSYFSTKKAITNQVYDRLTSLRIEKKNQIERFFEDRIHEADLLSNTNQVINTLITMNSNLDKNDFVSNQNPIQNKYFSKISFVDTNMHFNSIVFVNENVSIEIYKNNKYNAYLSEDIEIIDFEISDTSKTNFPIAKIIQPVEYENRTIGHLICEIPFSAINGIMLEQNQFKTLGETGEIYLVGSDYLFRSSSRFEDFKDFNTKVKTKSVDNALNNKQGTEIITDYRGVKVLSSFCKLNLQNLEWVIIAEIDKKEAMVPVISLSSQNVFLTIFVSITVFIFAYFIAKNITGKVVKINKAANKVGDGDFSVRLNIEANDEIGQLAESFNFMVERLRNQSLEIQKERAAKLSSLFEGQEIERQRLSRELHDGLGQKLIATKLQLESFILHDEENRNEKINHLRKQFDEIIDEIRRMSNNLMPTVLNEFGLKTAIENLCLESQKITGIEFIFETNGNIDIFEENSKNHLFRIIQETVNNSIKHSKSTNVFIYIEEISKHLTIIIKDNGIGFNINRKNKGNGLANIKERVALLNGKLSINSEIGKGTRIKIEIEI